MIKNLLLITAFAGVSMSAFADDLRATAISEADAAGKIKETADAAAEDSVKWKFPCKVGIDFGQTGYNYAWTGAPHSTVSLSGYGDVQANYKHGRTMWRNELFAEYGAQKSSENVGNNGWRKNLDNLNLNSKFGYRATKHWYYSALFDLKTQMSNTYEYSMAGDSLISERKSGAFAPANMVLSLGLDYVPNKYVSVFMSPLTDRIVNCRTNYLREACGIDYQHHSTKSQLGMYFRILNDFEIVKNVTFTSKFDVFSPWIDDNDKILNHFVCNWDALLTMKVNKYINAKFRWQMKYDDAVKCEKYSNGKYVTELDADGNPIGRSAKVQWMDAINIGFSYNF